MHNLTASGKDFPYSSRSDGGLRFGLLFENFTRLFRYFMVLIENLRSDTILFAWFLVRLLCSWFQIYLDHLLSFTSLVDSCSMVCTCDFLDKHYSGFVSIMIQLILREFNITFFVSVFVSTKTYVLENLFSHPREVLLIILRAELIFAMDFWHKRTIGWQLEHPVFIWCLSHYHLTNSLFELITFWCLWVQYF